MRTSASRSVALLTASLLLSVGAIVACQKKAAPSADAVPSEKELRTSLAGLEPELAALNAKFATLGKQVEATPPDLPGFGEVRAKYCATDEGMGIMGPKLSWLSARLDAALKSRKPEELAQVAKEIAKTYAELHQIDRLSLELLHQLLRFRSETRDAEAARASDGRSSERSNVNNTAPPDALVSHQ